MTAEEPNQLFYRMIEYGKSYAHVDRERSKLSKEDVHSELSAWSAAAMDAIFEDHRRRLGAEKSLNSSCL